MGGSKSIYYLLHPVLWMVKEGNDYLLLLPVFILIYKKEGTEKKNPSTKVNLFCLFRKTYLCYCSCIKGIWSSVQLPSAVFSFQ